MPTVQTSDFKKTWKGKSRKRRAPKRKNLTRKDVSEIVDKKLEKKAESKFFDLIGQTGQLVSSAPLVLDLCNPGQGASQIQRTGEEIEVKNLFFRGAIYGNATLEPSTTYFKQEYRIMIIQWFDDNGVTAPTTSALLQNSTNPYSWYERQNAGSKFRVLYDNRGLVSGSQGSPDAQHYLEFTIPGKKIRPIKFDGSATDGTNHLFIVAYSNQTGLAYAPYFRWNTHVTYSDM